MELKYSPDMDGAIRKVMAGEYDMPTDPPPRTVLDIGANYGAFSVWASDRWPDAEINAYEPQPEVAAIARENLIGRKGMVHAVAVREFAGVGRMFLGPANKGEASFHREGEESVTVQYIAAATIPSAEFVKVDTEGCELEIICNIDLSATRFIAFEYHRKDDVNPLRAFLFGKGFKLHSHDKYNDHCGVLKFTKHVQTKRIFLANCVDAGAKHLWYKCLERLAEHPPCEMTQQDVVGDSLIPRARNALSSAFVKSDCSHLLFIDSDIVFTSAQVAQLLTHNVEVIAGFYAKKQQDLHWVCNAFDEQPPADETTGLQKLKYMGTGFMLIHRSVFERMIERFPEIAYSPDDRPDELEWDFWPTGVYQYPCGDRRYLSEDWYFCQRCHDIDIPVYGDTRIVVQHIGDATFPLNHHRSAYVVKK